MIGQLDQVADSAVKQLDQVANSAVKLIAPVGGVDACREAVKDLIAENGVALANRKAMSKTKAARKAAGRVHGQFQATRSTSPEPSCKIAGAA